MNTYMSREEDRTSLFYRFPSVMHSSATLTHSRVESHSVEERLGRVKAKDFGDDTTRKWMFLKET